MHTAIYVRQSVSRADSVSLETQEALCRGDAPQNAPVEVYADSGFSGKNTDRPALTRMMQAAKAGQLSAVIVYKLDRISRNLADFTQLLRIFQAHGIRFISHTERFETDTPMGQAMQSLLMVFAQLERETISGRVRDAAFARAKIGFDTGGTAPIGFRKVPALLDGKSTQMLAIDDAAPIIAEGFRRYLAPDCSLAALAAHWNRQGMMTARGNVWTSAAVGRILRNPVYAMADMHVYTYLSSLGAELCAPDPLPLHHGVFLYADRRANHAKFTDLHDVLAICAPHEGFVAAETWLACQQKLTAHRQARTLAHGKSSIYGGLLFCARCGSAVTVTRGRSAEYLVCAGRKRGKCGGIGATWRKTDAESLLSRALMKRLQSLPLPAPHTSSAAAAAKQNLESAKLRKARLEQSLIDLNDTDIPVVAAAISKLSARCAVLEQQIAAEAQTCKTNAFPRFSSCTDAQKRGIAHSLIHCVTFENTTMHLYWL